MASEIIATLVGLFCTVTSGAVTFFLTKRKYNTEVDSQQIQNMNDSFNVYKKMMEETVELQNKKIEMLMEENENLKKQINQLQLQVINLIGTKAETRGSYTIPTTNTTNTQEVDK